MLLHGSCAHDSKDHVLSGIYYSVLVRNTCQHSQQNDVDLMLRLVHSLRRWPSIKPALVQHLTFVQCWTNVLCLLGIAAGLALLNTAGGDYKPTLTQCLLNVGPASPALAGIHSVLVITSCCRYLYTGSMGRML